MSTSDPHEPTPEYPQDGGELLPLDMTDAEEMSGVLVPGEPIKQESVPTDRYREESGNSLLPNQGEPAGKSEGRGEVGMWPTEPVDTSPTVASKRSGATTTKKTTANTNKSIVPVVALAVAGLAVFVAVLGALWSRGSSSELDALRKELAKTTGELQSISRQVQTADELAASAIERAGKADNKAQQAGQTAVDAATKATDATVRAGSVEVKVEALHQGERVVPPFAELTTAKGNSHDSATLKALAEAVVRAETAAGIALSQDQIAAAAVWAKTVAPPDPVAAAWLQAIINADDLTPGLRIYSSDKTIESRVDGPNGTSASGRHDHQASEREMVFVALLAPTNIQTPSQLASDPVPLTDKMLWDFYVGIYADERSTSVAQSGAAIEVARLQRKYGESDKAISTCADAIALIKGLGTGADYQQWRAVFNQRLLVLSDIHVTAREEVARARSNQLALDAASRSVTTPVSLQNVLKELGLNETLEKLKPFPMDPRAATWTEVDNSFQRLVELSRAASFDEATTIEVEDRLHKVRAGMLTLLAPPIDLQAAQKLLAELQERLDLIAKRLSAGDPLLGSINAGTTRIQTLQKQLDDPLTVASSQAVVSQISDVHFGVVQLELRYLARDKAPQVVTRATVDRFLDELGLEDSDSVSKLQPGTKPTWLTKQHGDRHARLWVTLEGKLKALRGADEIPANQTRQTLSTMHDVLYAVLELQTRKQLELVRSQRPPGPEQRGDSPGDFFSDLDLAAAIDKLTRELAAQQTVHQQQLDARLATMQREMRGEMQDKVLSVLDKPRPLPPQQLGDIVSRVVDDAMTKLATFGYSPPPLPTPNGSGPARVEATNSQSDSEAARELFARGYNAYFAANGTSDQSIAHFTEAVRNDPYSPVYRYFLALALHREGRDVEASAQIRAGKKCETANSKRQVPVALERVQGSDRTWLEKLRLQA